MDKIDVKIQAELNGQKLEATIEIYDISEITSSLSRFSVRYGVETSGEISLSQSSVDLPKEFSSTKTKDNPFHLLERVLEKYHEDFRKFNLRVRRKELRK